MSANYNYPDRKPAEKPPVLVDTYGSRPPKAAEFDGGISDRAGAAEAADARRNAPLGGYRRPLTPVTPVSN